MEWYLSLSVVLIGIGIGMLAAEFLFPTAGILVVGAITAFAVAVGITLYYGDLREAAAVTVAVCIGLPIAGSMMLSGYKRMSLKSSLDPDFVQDVTALSESAKLKGKFGKTLTPMRPSGAVEIDGQRVDAMTEGLMLDAGTTIKCVDIRGGRVIVRQVDNVKPTELNLNLDDLQ